MLKAVARRIGFLKTRQREMRIDLVPAFRVIEVM